MNRGKKTCKILKEIRQQIADNNDIKFVTSECHFQGECKGTCPKCEAEVRYLESELNKRRQLGKAVTIAGISLGIASSFSACHTPKQDNILPSSPEISTEIVSEKEQPSVLDTNPPPSFKVNDMFLDGFIFGDVDVTNTLNYEPVPIPGQLEQPDGWLMDVIEGEIDTPTPEFQPEYPGGKEALYQFLVEHLEYPKETYEKKIEGVVIVSFTVEEDGSISNIKIVNDIGYGCGEKVVRVIKIMPKWKAAQNNGKSVRSHYNLPVSFSIDGDTSN